MGIKVSVIIPVYNVERYLQDCIDSLVNQTLKDIELIFVNDCSTDRCLDILLNNKKIYPNKIIVINSKVNLKQGGARNLGIKVARGEYIGFVDSDDLVAPDMYEVLYSKISEKDLDAAFIKYQCVEENFKLSEYKFNIDHVNVWREKLLELDEREMCDYDIEKLMVYPIGGVWSGLWRKSIIVNNQIFFPEQLRYEDNYWGTIMMAHLKKVGFINSVKYYYRKNLVSTTNRRNENYFYDRIIIEDMIDEYFRSRFLYEKYKNALEYIYI